MKFRGLPKYVNYGLVLFAISFLLMLLKPNDTGLYSLKNLFLLSWIILSIIIAAYMIREWYSTARSFAQRKNYVRLSFHFGILILIIWIIVNVVWGLIEGMLHS